MTDPGFTFGYGFIQAIIAIINYLKLHFAILPPKILF